MKPHETYYFIITIMLLFVVEKSIMCGETTF